VLQSIGAGVYERARSCLSELTNRYDSSECSDVSELLFERALGVETASVWILRGNHFVYMRQSGGGCPTTFYFDESGALYICVARYNEYVNFRMKMSLRFTFI